MTSKTKVTPGFTLIETLVVVALIAVLAALVFPLGSKAINAARDTECRSRLRTLGLAHLNYAADHNGSFITSANPGGKEGYWFDVLGHYIGEPVLWVNGIQGGTIERIPKWLECPSKPGVIGYGWNQNFGKQSYQNITDPDAFRRLIGVAQPSRTILHGDSKDPEIMPTLDYENWYLYSGSGWKTRMATRHPGGTGNYFFVDGHIESLTPDQINVLRGTPGDLFKPNKEAP